MRLRLAEVDNLSNFSAGVDDVKVVSTAPPPVAPPSNSFTFGKVKLNKKKGKRVKKATVATVSAGTATLVLKPTAAGMNALEQKGKLPFKLAVTFTPTGGTAASQTFSGKLKLTPKHQAPKS